MGTRRFTTQFSLTDAEGDTIDALKPVLGVRSNADVVRKALALLRRDAAVGGVGELAITEAECALARERLAAARRNAIGGLE